MKKILIIEDDAFLSEMYAAKLTGSNFLVETALDGEIGLKKIEEFQPDLILLDIVLPKMDGYEVLRRVKADSKLKKIPVILLTNLGQRSDLEKGLSLGADEYIIKAHFSPGAVVEKIKKILNR